MPVSRSKRRKANPARDASGTTVRPKAEDARPPLFARWLEPGRNHLPAAVLLFLAAPAAVLVSQTVPHIYGFGELGFLFPFTVYDVALAILGLGFICAGFETTRQFLTVGAVFVAMLVLSLADFVGLWQVFLHHGLDEQIYLVTPAAVGLTGVSLWLPRPLRYPAALVLAVLLAFDLALFVGLQEFAYDLNVFSIGGVLAAGWILLSPAFLLRQFRRPWLTIAGRILGSWLVAIELLIFTFAVVPMPTK